MQYKIIDNILSSGKRVKEVPNRCELVKLEAKIDPLAFFAHESGEIGLKFEAICAEKFTKCSLHSPSTGCIIVALYWLDYTIENSLASERRKWIDGMQRMRFV